MTDDETTLWASVKNKEEIEKEKKKKKKNYFVT